MTSKKARHLIVKYLNKQATLLERERLEDWLETPANYKTFKEYIRANYFSNVSMGFYNTEDSKQELLDLIRSEKRENRWKKSYSLMKYAAVLLVMLGLGYLYQSGYFEEPKKNNIPADSIILQLENGNIEIIDEHGSSQVVDANGNVVGAHQGKQLVYNSKLDKQELNYNTLTVPFGKRFKVQLSDGTLVHLNAGTSLRYPVSFVTGRLREVFLTGEAFFKVAEDSAHAFVVNANSLNVEVLGTEFNVTSYPEDEETNVVLVEGSVGLYPEKQQLEDGVKIAPGIMGSFNTENQEITTEEVDTTIYTSWMEGALVFRNMPFKNIVSKLERHFNMKIVISNEKLEEEVFSATFKEEPTIDGILKAFGKSHGINYTIQNNAIQIN